MACRISQGRAGVGRPAGAGATRYWAVAWKMRTSQRVCEGVSTTR